MYSKNNPKLELIQSKSISFKNFNIADNLNSDILTTQQDINKNIPGTIRK